MLIRMYSQYLSIHAGHNSNPSHTYLPLFNASPLLIGGTSDELGLHRVFTAVPAYTRSTGHLR